MAYKRKEVEDIDRYLRTGVKKFVRYDEGAKIYSMGYHSFRDLAQKAKAVYRVNSISLINLERIDAYLENLYTEQSMEDEDE
ncbi:MAG: DUF6462 family protein [Butyrivibrio crossotus]|nr:DUF6462 family protein [Butyrivibrio crossotus]